MRVELAVFVLIIHIPQHTIPIRVPTKRKVVIGSPRHDLAVFRQRDRVHTSAAELDHLELCLRVIGVQEAIDSRPRLFRLGRPKAKLTTVARADGKHDERRRRRSVENARRGLGIALGLVLYLAALCGRSGSGGSLR